jgi:hypothetical protein
MNDCLIAYQAHEDDHDRIAAVLRTVATDILDHHHRSSAYIIAQLLLKESHETCLLSN